MDSQVKSSQVKSMYDHDENILNVEYVTRSDEKNTFVLIMEKSRHHCE
jgi:hypothetical protein